MEKVQFSQLPGLIKAAVGITFFNSWIIFEETVIDRFGLWEYLPFYKIGTFCVWDILAILAIVLVGLFLNKVYSVKREKLKS
jgi:hypothetical protein